MYINYSSKKKGSFDMKTLEPHNIKNFRIGVNMNDYTKYNI